MYFRFCGWLLKSRIAAIAKCGLDEVACEFACLSLCLLLMFVSPAKRLNGSRCRLVWWLGWDMVPRIRWGVQISQGKRQFVGLSGPLKSIVSHCCGVRSKKPMTASAWLLHPTALLPTDRYDINISPWKIARCDAPCHQNSLTTC